MKIHQNRKISEALALIISINLVETTLIRCIYLISFIVAVSDWHLGASHIIYLIRINILFLSLEFTSSDSLHVSGTYREKKKQMTKKSKSIFVQLVELQLVSLFFPFFRLSAF